MEVKKTISSSPQVWAFITIPDESSFSAAERERELLSRRSRIPAENINIYTRRNIEHFLTRCPVAVRRCLDIVPFVTDLMSFSIIRTNVPDNIMEHRYLAVALSYDLGSGSTTRFEGLSEKLWDMLLKQKSHYLDGDLMWRFGTVAVPL